MANKRPKVDAVIVGLGWAGSLMANELTDAGLNVVAIERGAWRDTSTDFPTTIDTDELRYARRRELLQPLSVETMTFRNKPSQEALPLREMNTYQFGWGVGGAGSHWNGMTWRFLPTDFVTYSHTIEKYGKKRFVEGLQVQDWGVTYDELEHFYDKFERIAGTSGKAGNIGGNKIDGGNVFEGPRQRDYPLPPLARTQASLLFDKAAKSLGWHPFPVPAGNTSGAYTNTLGVKMAPCTYCGYCEFFGCGNWSKSSPQACVLPALMMRKNFSVIPNAEVLQVNLTADKKMATGVTFIDNEGQEWEQPADIVVLSAYQFDNVRLMLLSGIGKPYDHTTGEGVVGRNYAYQTISGASIWFKNETLNPFIGAGALAQAVDDFNGDNFDHSKEDFIGGGTLLIHSTGGRPIGLTGGVPPGTPQWGAEWKKAYQKAYQNYNSIYVMGNSYPHRDVFLDLDPTYKDRHGRPLLRVTFDWNENDKRIGKFMADRSMDMADALGVETKHRSEPTAEPYTPMTNLSSHTTGGACMGDDPRTSAVNKYLQSWDVPNTFVCGASAFANNGGYNPTGTVAALTLHAAQAIREQYLKSPGPLVKV
ncbi:gluconate 2-dehydrogenase alpha chain [Herbaspirillum sp. Sphag1AN]|uniref:GMC family oxidoreductase n=1 Tax=unclassified Herbaspirillum TaxID=2624150 RepID=UPI001609D83A|nr:MULTISPECIES: GMC family oxidoreductase [unclassified Herbaspirillum]MBB3211643.1 gluconate 2-dehydrogenase alpha chain [Herbaspirillum sp. Sphag1AN]MBB3245089.1 gluconate 2-dehydrogenase alpha chain [Herbaspirillum sp. Sphag64]